MFVISSTADPVDVFSNERWLDVPEMIVKGTLDINSDITPYRSISDGLGGISTEFAAATGTVSSSFGALTGGWSPPTDLILISFFDESSGSYHTGAFPSGFPGVQPTDDYTRDFEHFVGTYSPLTGNSNKLNSFKGIIYPVMRGNSVTDDDMLNNINAAFVIQTLAAWSGTTLTQNEIDGVVEFGNQFINGVLTNDTAGYGYTFSLISSNANSGWSDGIEEVNVTPLLTSNPYSALVDSNGDPGLWQHGWIISLDKRQFNTDGTQRAVFEPVTFTNDINNLIGVDVPGVSDPFIGTFPAGSIIFVEEAFYTINESLTFSAVGNFSIGLASATYDGYNSTAIPMYPALQSFGLNDSREVFFPMRSSGDIYKHQGHTEISNSPLSIVKLTEPAMLMIDFEEANAVLQYGELTVHVPYIVDNPGPPIIKPQGPTAYISARPLIVGSSSQSGGSGGLGSSQFLPLPVPKINLMQGGQLVDVYDGQTNGVFGTQAIIVGHPVLINTDFTSDHFSNPENRIFIEMVHYKRKSSSFDPPLGPRTYKGASYTIPSKQIANVGQDTNLPWLSTPGVGFWSRGGTQHKYDYNTNTSVIIGIDRPNHYEVYGYTISSYPIWQYFTGRFEYFGVAYRDSSNAYPSFYTLIPSSGKRRAGRNQATNRFAYSPFYTPYYCAFRYIQWIPSANGGKGQIVSGPLSKIIKVTGHHFPFQANYVKSAQFGLPVCDINPIFIPHPYLTYELKCNWESNVP